MKKLVLTAVLTQFILGCSIYQSQVETCQEGSSKIGCAINSVIWTPAMALAEVKKKLFPKEKKEE